MTFYLTSPATVLEARRRAMRRLIDETVDSEPTFTIPMNLTSSEDDYLVTAFLPGLESESVNIQFNNGILTIDGEYPEVQQESRETHLAELPVGKFHRAIEFNNPIAADKVEATLKNGILTIRVPKAEEAKPKTIKVVTK